MGVLFVGMFMFGIPVVLLLLLGGLLIRNLKLGAGTKRILFVLMCCLAFAPIPVPLVASYVSFVRNALLSPEFSVDWYARYGLFVVPSLLATATLGFLLSLLLFGDEGRRARHWDIPP